MYITHPKSYRYKLISRSNIFWIQKSYTRKGYTAENIPGNGGVGVCVECKRRTVK